MTEEKTDVGEEGDSLKGMLPNKEKHLEQMKLLNNKGFFLNECASLAHWHLQILHTINLHFGCV